jgi:hypothetical protein
MEPTQVVIDEKLQNMVNKPPVDPTGFDQATKEFIENVMRMVFEGKIDLFKPETVINKPKYDLADQAHKGKADIFAINLCAKLRELKELTDISGGEQLYIEPTYQAKLLVEDIKYRKEEFESAYGDLMII